MTRVDEIRARLAAATPGPWHPDGPDVLDTNGQVVTCCDDADADLIANAPDDLAYLMSRLDTAFETIRQLHTQRTKEKNP